MEALKNVVNYEYYDTPDGTDYFKKLVSITKYVAPISIIVATHDVMLYSHPKGYGPIMARYLAYAGPALGMTAAFTTATFLSANIRKKDDYWNYLAGGVASGSVYGAFRSSMMAGFKCSVAMSALVMIVKHSNTEGYSLFPEPKLRMEGGPNYVKNQDFTITKYIPGNWTRDPKEV